MVAIPGDCLIVKFELKTDEGFRETILGTGEYSFHGDPYTGLLQIRSDDQTIIGILLFEIRWLTHLSMMQLTSNSFNLNQNDCNDNQNLIIEKSSFDITTQIKEDTDSISESEISSLQQTSSINQQYENSSIDSNNYFDNMTQLYVRTISKTCSFSVEKIFFNISIDQLQTTIFLLNNLFFQQQQQQNDQSKNNQNEEKEGKEGKEEKLNINQNESNMTTKSIYLHSGQLIRCCGDYRSSIISSTILKR